MGFFHEIEFAGEEVVEIDQLGVAFDDRVRVLFKRQPDVEAKTVFAPCASLGGPHDAVAGTGDYHVILGHHLASEFFRHLILRFARRRPGRPENTDLPELAVPREDLGGVSHFLERPVHQLQVARPHSVTRHL